MAGYDVFARYYDALTANVDYKGRAAYLKKLLEHLHHEPGIVLDLACGTGSLTLEPTVIVRSAVRRRVLLADQGR